jgi:enoyl-CoA hydratase/carnithine racemase
MEENEMLVQQRKGRVGTLIFNRPERQNALSPDLLVRLHLALQAWAEEGEVRAVVITGAGERAFSSGYDIRAIPTRVTPETERLLRRKNPLDLALDGVKSFPYPTIAMVNGYCFGAALNLALCCDLRVGADDIAVGMTPAKLGVVYPPDGLMQFVQVLGQGRTRELFFTGRTYRGAEVAAMGLVDRLVPRAELVATTYALAEEMAANAPLSVKGIKRLLNLIEASSTLGEEARREAGALLANAFNSEDLKEGQAAFIEKRTPRFRGR